MPGLPAREPPNVSGHNRTQSGQAPRHGPETKILRLQGSFNIGALIIRIGFWGAYHTIVIIRNPQNSIGNYISALYYPPRVRLRYYDEMGMGFNVSGWFYKG